MSAKTLASVCTEDDFRIFHHLLTRWKNLHARYRVCCKRVNWYNKKASIIEKRRRREKWEIVASVLQIENEIIRLCADLTHNPQIYTPKKGKPRSQLLQLRQRYARNRRDSHNVEGSPEQPTQKIRKHMRNERIVIVARIREIIRHWIKIVYTHIFGDVSLPKPLPLHRAELIPRKLKRAYITLRKELAA